MSREAGLEKKRCSKRRMPRERDINGKRLKRHRCQETAMTSEKTSQERRVCQVSGSRAVDKKGCQDSDMSVTCRIRRKWQQETKMSRARNVKDKDFQEIAQSTAVPARGSGPGASLSRNFRHPACPGSTCAWADVLIFATLRHSHQICLPVEDIFGFGHDPIWRRHALKEGPAALSVLRVSKPLAMGP